MGAAVESSARQAELLVDLSISQYQLTAFARVPLEGILWFPSPLTPLAHTRYVPGSDFLAHEHGTESVAFTASPMNAASVSAPYTERTPCYEELPLQTLRRGGRIGGGLGFAGGSPVDELDLDVPHAAEVVDHGAVGDIERAVLLGARLSPLRLSAGHGPQSDAVLRYPQ